MTKTEHFRVHFNFLHDNLGRLLILLLLRLLGAQDRVAEDSGRVTSLGWRRLKDLARQRWLNSWKNVGKKKRVAVGVESEIVDGRGQTCAVG